MFKHGDLIFSQLSTDANAISAVTRGLKGARLNHMGLILNNSVGWFVLEAFPPEVRVTQVDVFTTANTLLARSIPTVICAWPSPFESIDENRKPIMALRCRSPLRAASLKFLLRQSEFLLRDQHLA